MNQELPQDFLSNCLFLFGAGASKDAGMPLTNELYDELISTIDERHKLNTSINPKWSEYIKYFYQLSGNNFEHAIAIIKYLSVSELKKHPLYLAINFVQGNREIESKERVDLFRKCWKFISHQFLQEKLKAKQENLSYLNNLMKLAKMRQLSIFTLNYDDVIETSCEQESIDVQLGFRKIEGKEWFNNSFEEKESGIRLYKLHGSINWKCIYIAESYYKQICKGSLGMNRDNTTFYDAAIIMGYEKLEVRGHFLEMLFIFRENLSKSNYLCIVGYSFQDGHINKLLLEWLSKDTEKKKILVIDPGFNNNNQPNIIYNGEFIKKENFFNVFSSYSSNFCVGKCGFKDFLESIHFDCESENIVLTTA